MIFTSPPQPSYPFHARQFLDAVAACKIGSLRLTTPTGEILTFQGETPGQNVDMQIHDWDIIPQIALRSDIALGETYALGLWDTSDLSRLMIYCLDNSGAIATYDNGHGLMRMALMLYNYWIKRNSKKGSRNNIRAHYDLGNNFYGLWLDPSMTYSSALRHSKEESLENAQTNKYGRILSRLDKRAERLLEIGCGWGGFAEQAANLGRHVTGLTISAAQHDFAIARLKNKADIKLQDYRNLKGRFDSIVSIEMFEAVGERYWNKFFRTVKNCMSEGGKAVIQTIVLEDKAFDFYRKRSDFIRHHIFPGGMLPSPTRFALEAQKTGLKCNDVFTFGQDYAWTLRQWLQRFNLEEKNIRKLGYDDVFIRKWHFYFNMCIAGFEAGRTDVMQVELVHI